MIYFHLLHTQKNGNQEKAELKILFFVENTYCFCRHSGQTNKMLFA